MADIRVTTGGDTRVTTDTDTRVTTGGASPTFVQLERGIRGLNRGLAVFAFVVILLQF